MEPLIAPTSWRYEWQRLRLCGGIITVTGTREPIFELFNKINTYTRVRVMSAPREVTVPTRRRGPNGVVIFGEANGYYFSIVYLGNDN
jgi:hypothetical protein